MRVAVCISGEARFAESNYARTKRQLIDSTGNPDVYYFFWETTDSRMGTDPYKAIELYKPVDYKIVPQKIFDTTIIDSNNSIESDGKRMSEHRELLYWKFQRLLSMFYAIQQADLLRDNSYDCVVRIRTDTAFNCDVNMDVFKANSNSLCCYRVIPFNDDDYRHLRYRYGDELWYGNSDVMRRISSLYDSIPKLIGALNCIRPDQFVSYFVENLSGISGVKDAGMGVPRILVPEIDSFGNIVGSTDYTDESIRGKNVAIGKPRRYWP